MADIAPVLIPKPYVCVDQKGQFTEFYATYAEAEDAACALGMAPFTVMELRPHPVGQRLTSKQGDARYKVEPIRAKG